MTDTELPKYTIEEAKALFAHQECASSFHTPTKHFTNGHDAIGIYMCECEEFRWTPEAQDIRNAQGVWYVDAEGFSFKKLGGDGGTWAVPVVGDLWRSGTAEEMGVVFPVTPDLGKGYSDA